MREVASAIVEFLRESGYTCEWEGGVCVKLWRGPKRCEPVMYSLQFTGLLDQSACHSGDWSDKLNVWCQYTDINDHPMSFGDTMRAFSLTEPDVFDDLVNYLRFHDGNAHEQFGGECKFQRENRLRDLRLRGEVSPALGDVSFGDGGDAGQ